jgi:hypothetical protein
MSWAELFHKLWLADWSAGEIAEAYDTNEDRVRALVGSKIVETCDEIRSAA